MLVVLVTDRPLDSITIRTVSNLPLALAGMVRCTAAAPFLNVCVCASCCVPTRRSDAIVPIVKLAPLSLRVTGTVSVNAFPAIGFSGDVVGAPITGLTLVRLYDQAPPSGPPAVSAGVSVASTVPAVAQKSKLVAPPRSLELTLIQ